LEEIHRYIAADNPLAAEKFSEKLLQESHSLRQLPERGFFIKEKRGARVLIYKPYLIVYRVDKEAKKVRILRYWHSAREQKEMRLS